MPRHRIQRLKQRRFLGWSTAVVLTTVACSGVDPTNDSCPSAPCGAVGESGGGHVHGGGDGASPGGGAPSAGGGDGSTATGGGLPSAGGGVAGGAGGAVGGGGSLGGGVAGGGGRVEVGRGPGSVFEVSVSPAPTERFASAQFRIYIPDGVTRIRAIIIHQHGCGRQGLSSATDVHWQALANKWASALLGTRLTDRGTCSDWYNPANGSLRALQTALNDLGGKSGHPELGAAPWVLWGHSGGSLWSSAVTNMLPERVIANFARSGPDSFSAGALLVPTALAAGVNDIANLAPRTRSTFATERPRGALVALSIDPKSAHDIREGRFFAIPYLDAVLAQRLPPSGNTLLPMNASRAWLGDNTTFNVTPAAMFPGSAQTASWLPDENAARKWAEFSKSGSARDTTPPPVPTQLKALIEGASVRLTWLAESDLEGGTQFFSIFRNGQRLARVGNPFQAGNFGDEPEPANPKMEFIDTAPPGGAVTYEVTQTNFSNLESSRSPSAMVQR